MSHPTIRACAQEITAAIERQGGDGEALRAAIAAPLRELMQRDDLRELGIPRQGNNVAFSRYLYFDGELSILLFEVPSDRKVPPHDHGVWEGFCVYRGKVQHTVYRRADDGSVDGYAELETVQDEVMEPGDVAIVAPPADIHGFVALEEGTLGITVVNGAYKEERLYYQPDEKTYVVKKQRTAR
jgi:predicted metal-dependent enzyme (double-stranded beta helix superfamily)